MTDRLFVYGTLRTGASATHVMRRVGERVGRARARGMLIDCGRYPGLIDTPEDRWVVGEVWSLHDPMRALPELDTYEGDEYERVRREVLLETGARVAAWVYVFTDDPSPHPPVATGDWLTHRRG